MLTSRFKTVAVLVLASALSVSALPQRVAPDATAQLAARHRPTSWYADTCHCPDNRDYNDRLFPAYQAIQNIYGDYTCYYLDASGQSTNICGFDMNNGYQLESTQGTLCPQRGLAFCPAPSTPAAPAPTSA